MQASTSEVEPLLPQLRDSHEDLCNLRSEVVHTALERLRQAWLAPDSPWMRAYLAEAAPALRLSEAMLRELLLALLQSFSPRALQQLLRSELGSPDPFAALRAHPESGVRYLWLSPALSIHILPSGTPTLPFETFFLTSLVRAPSLMRCSAGLLPALRVLEQSVAELAPDFASSFRVATWPHEESAALLSRAELVVAYGDDATLSTLRAPLPATVRFLGYGHRVSFGVIDSFAGEEASMPALEALCEGIALDTSMADQRGCMSLQTLFVHEACPVRIPELLDTLAQTSFPAVATRFPRGPLRDDEAAAIMQLRGRTEFSGNAWTGRDFTLVSSETCAFFGGFGGRTLHVVPYRNESELLETLAPLRRHLSSCALLAPVARRDHLATLLARAGTLRITRFGRMQRPLLLRTHDGLPRLSSWLLRADVEHA